MKQLESTNKSNKIIEKTKKKNKYFIIIIWFDLLSYFIHYIVTVPRKSNNTILFYFNFLHIKFDDSIHFIF